MKGVELRKSHRRKVEGWRDLSYIVIVNKQRDEEEGEGNNTEEAIIEKQRDEEI